MSFSSKQWKEVRRLLCLKIIKKNSKKDTGIKKKKQGEMLFISTDEFEPSEFFCSEFSI